MAPRLSALRTMTDEQLIEAHDSMAPHTSIGIAYYLDELRRREANSSANAALTEAANARRLAIINAIVAVIALIAAVVVPLLTAPPKTEPCIAVVGKEQRAALCLVP